MGLLDVLRKIAGCNIELEIKGSYLIVYSGSRVNVVKYLIVEEAEIGVKDIDPDELYSMVERFSSIFSKLPPGSEVKMVRLSRNLSKLRRSIENEMANIKAVLETVRDPHVIKRLEYRFNVLARIYSRILSAGDVVRVIAIFKIRGEGLKSEANKVLEDLERISDVVKSLISSFTGFKVRDASSKEVKEIISYEIGLTNKLGVKAVIIDEKKVGILSPIPYVKRPSIENYYNGVYLGLDLDTGWPVIIDKEMFFKHVLIVGPTGRGKTTTLALIIENLLSLYDSLPLIIDFKGDLADLLKDAVIPRITPLDAPINLLIRPETISYVDWTLMISDILVKVLKLDIRRVSSIIRALMNRDVEEYIHDPGRLVTDPDLSVLSSIVDLVTITPNYKKLLSVVNRGGIIDLSDLGTTYQNIYGAMVLHVASYLVTTSKLRDRIIVVDEAWRVSKIKALYTLIKEGRSKRIGLVLATQNIEDIPAEIIENIHTLIVFGSHNDEYVWKIARILGLKKGVVEGLKRLSVGEALLLNSLDPHPVFIKVESPSVLRKTRKL